MSSLLSIGMASSKKEKHYANSRARRHSGDIVISQSKKSKKDKDTDTESVSSSTPSSAADTVVVPPPGPKKCPLRFMLAGMMEGEDEEKKAGGCPLRRVQLWHTIPLCLLAIINLLLVIIALLGLAGYRITMGIQNFLVNLAKTDLECNPYAESLADTDDGTLVTEKE
jgi:hypothetical protein